MQLNVEYRRALVVLEDRRSREPHGKGAWITGSEKERGALIRRRSLDHWFGEGAWSADSEKELGSLIWRRSVERWFGKGAWITGSEKELGSLIWRRSVERWYGEGAGQRMVKKPDWRWRQHIKQSCQFILQLYFIICIINLKITLVVYLSTVNFIGPYRVLVKIKSLWYNLGPFLYVLL